jgi:16S rRNA (cytosine1402-N4)-methyltransferase
VTNEYRHTPVLLAECLEYLEPKKSCIFADATLGGAGHSLEFAKAMGKSGHLIGIDQDKAALKAAHARLLTIPENDRPAFSLLHGNFGELDELLLRANVPGIDVILFDLGVSSAQIDTISRGFSFKEMAPLDMRMDSSKQNTNAAEIINTYNEADLTRIFRDYGEEKWASRIAKFVIEKRQTKRIETSEQLVDIIKAAIPTSARRLGGHPAKRVFQALRIEVNAELEKLRLGLESAIRWLNPKGRIGVISYHSLEDRIVKNILSENEDRCTCPPDLPICVCNKEPILKVITHKPVLPTEEEVKRNTRSRSAKLRVAEKIG